MQETLFEVPVMNGVLERMGPSASALGSISEQLAIAKLVTRGLKVAVPVIDDDGVDLIVNYHTTVQVKSTGLRRSGNGWRYEFSLCDKGTGGKRGKGGGHRYASVDFFVFHGRDTDEWWVAPKSELPNFRQLTVVPGGQERWKDAWRVFDDV
jgi:hypothetical protein